ncbi:MAG: hypothetical protein ISS82_03650 [Nanoarchaeota archaeon]|nr:hypothetical protein [Nanoarchaeota archaeon]
MFRDKKSQVTMFIILGIVILAVIFSVFYFLGDRILKQSEKDVVFTESSLEPLKDYVEDCIKKYGDEGLDLVGKQGGDIEPEFYLTYTFLNEDYSSKINYLCYTESFEPCANRRPLLARHVENELKNYIMNGLNTCVDLELIRNEGYKIEEGERELDVSIGTYNVIVNLDYPITITKGDTTIKEERFVKTFNVPLGKLIDVTKDIVDFEIINGEFYNIPYMLENPRVEIEKHRPGDSKVYRVNIFQDDYFFQFAIQNFVY